jgi:hypothetical protein
MFWRTEEDKAMRWKIDNFEFAVRSVVIKRRRKERHEGGLYTRLEEYHVPDSPELKDSMSNLTM